MKYFNLINNLHDQHNVVLHIIPYITQSYPYVRRRRRRKKKTTQTRIERRELSCCIEHNSRIDWACLHRRRRRRRTKESRALAPRARSPSCTPILPFVTKYSIDIVKSHARERDRAFYVLCVVFGSPVVIALTRTDHNKNARHLIFTVHNLVYLW